MNSIDLRSDTVTIPTQKMREAMYKAEVGDAVYDSDPTTIELEEKSAEIFGKEAAIFVPSGTFGNQLAIKTHTARGNEFIAWELGHILYHEVGAAALISAVNARSIDIVDGKYDIEQIASKIRIDDLHYPETGLICVENALGNGQVVPLENMAKVYELAKEHNLPVHLDGARIFNAATHLDVNVKEIAKYSDSLMFCLSKGLCAPIGSLLLGTKDFIEKAKKGRKLLGGGLRQSGILAAAGIVGLDDMVDRLSEDHENAKYLADELEKIKGIKVERNLLDINMVFFDMKDSGYSDEKLVEDLAKENILISTSEDGLMRFVTHYWISKADIDKVISLMNKKMYS